MDKGVLDYKDVLYIKEPDYRNRDGVDVAASFWNHRR